MTVLSQVKGLVERWGDEDKCLAASLAANPPPATAIQRQVFEFSEMARGKMHERADDLLALLPAIEAQQEYIEKLEKALAVALADFTNEEQAAAQARLNESPATCYPDGGEIFDECLRARREQRTGKPADKGEGI